MEKVSENYDTDEEVISISTRFGNIIKAIIFDLDGTLIDSQPLHFVAYKEAFKNQGIDLTDEQWNTWVSEGYNAESWVDFNNYLIDFEKLIQQKQDYYIRLIHENILLKSGAIEVLEELRGKFMLALATSSRNASVNSIMEKLQLKKYFNVLLTGSDVNRKKPNPEILLKTLAEMDISNEEAVVIEDSQAGIQAAKAANIKCVICPDNYISYKNFDFSRADAIIKTLKQIKI